MKIERPNFFVITGGPGSGKTTLIDVLAARGFPHVEEAGRRIIREQLRTGGNATHEGDHLAFRDLMFTDAVQTFEARTGLQTPVFFDRGLPDLIGYSRLIGEEVPPPLKEAVTRYRYNNTVFVAPPWEAIYGNDAERKQDFAEAVATHDAVRAAYRDAGYALAELPVAGVETRVDFVLMRIGVQAERRAR